MSSYDRAHSLGYKYRCINHLSFARYLITIVPSTVIAALCNSSFPFANMLPLPRYKVPAARLGCCRGGRRIRHREGFVVGPVQQTLDRPF